MAGIEIVIKEEFGTVLVECAEEEGFEIKGDETVREVLERCKDYQARVLKELSEMIARLVIGKD